MTQTGNRDSRDLAETDGDGGDRRKENSREERASNPPVGDRRRLGDFWRLQTEEGRRSEACRTRD